MSEYQYYEFRTLDRRLTAEQQRQLRSLSSRAEISATRLTNEYSFGNFRGDPGRLLEEYFDAYLYAANWGTRELGFRLPRALLDAQTARRYCAKEYRAWVTETAEHVIIRFRWDDDEGDDWIEGDGLLDPLLAARGELAAGDTRLLYLGWLLTVQLGGLDDDEDEDLADRLEKQRLFQRLFTWVPMPDDAYARASEIHRRPRLPHRGRGHRAAGSPGYRHKLITTFRPHAPVARWSTRGPKENMPVQPDSNQSAARRPPQSASAGSPTCPRRR